MKGLEERFDKAYQIASAINQSQVPPDVMLRLYAYYKLATKDRPRFQKNLMKQTLEMLLNSMPLPNSKVLALQKLKLNTLKL